MNKLLLTMFFYLPFIINPQEISFNVYNPTLRAIILEVESQADLKFAYGEEVDLSTKLLGRFSFEKEGLDKVLEEITRRTPYTLSVVGNNIAIALDPPVEKPGIKTTEVQQIINGTVTDSDGMPLPSVTIQEEGTNNGVLTDFDGNFTIEVTSDDAVLVFTYIGMQPARIPVGGQTTMNVQMEADEQALEEVIVVGYGTQTVRELTGAVSQVKAEAIEKIATSDFTSALQGQMAGVNITQSSGAPGAVANVQIRGLGSLSADGTGPLYVVDGVPYQQPPNISPDAIASIEVLKDAASASIYGTRASNGVILITTKTGTPGQMRVNLDSYYGITRIARNIPLINNTADWLYVNRIRYLSVNAPGDFGWTSLQPGWHERGLYYNTNWTEMFQVDNAPIQNHSLRLSGGTETLTYSIVSTYFNQEGTWLNSGYERLSTRANTHFEKGKFSANVGLGLSFDKRNMSNPDLPIDAIRLRPFETPLEDYRDESFPEPESNPSAIANIARRIKQVNQEEGNNHSINMDLNYELFEGFTLRTNLGGFQYNTYSKLFEPRFTFYDEFTGEMAPGGFPIASLEVGQNFRQHWISEFMAIYEKSFGNHEISALAAYSREQTTRRSFSAGRRDFLSNDIQVLSGGAIDPTASGKEYVSSLTGAIGRIQYNFAERYLLSASVRRDGSSRFGEDYRYGVFPSFSAGWNIDEESFYENLGINSVLTSAKIRASYGTTGNQFIPDYLYAPVVSGGVDYVLGEPDQHLALGVTQVDFTNVDVKWETSIAKNLGLDLGFLDGAITFTGDAYVTNKSDMLFPVAVPLSAGSGGDGSVIMNVGNMTNKGYELASSYRKYGDDFGFTLTATFSQNSNEVTQTNLASSTIWGGQGGGATDPVSVIREGYPAGAFFLIPTDGLVTTEEEVQEYQNLVPGAHLGDLQYVDTNGDGTINDDDRIFMGSGNPDWVAGFAINANYLNFDFYAQLYGTYGNKIYNAIKSYAYAHKRHQDVLNAWTPSNPTSTIPTPRGSTSHANIRSRSDYFLEDGSYLRLRSVQVGYNFSESIMNNLAVNNLRIYIGVDNALTFTKYTGNDPEIGNDGLLNRGVDSGNIPVTSQFRAGLQLEF
ncbi:TonB-dependent receptor [Salegentibacter sp. F188]|uniref:TonB-dependent receptor n=1 Tax=Autumnicola patrickiae TaxID=3075591 RepID=A0ABU3DZE5_9FLAO|nr:TonB-dependent receptor [Salegentibacter sp. F188]MDT0689088.1 TonB-dependent receptor [Salegentibacter sp. F188]